jgi:hypothetical protein
MFPMEGVYCPSLSTALPERLTKLPGTPTLFPDGAGPLTLDHTGHLLYLSVGGGFDGFGSYSSIHGYRIALAMEL